MFAHVGVIAKNRIVVKRHRQRRAVWFKKKWLETTSGTIIRQHKWRAKFSWSFAHDWSCMVLYYSRCKCRPRPRWPSTWTHAYVASMPPSSKPQCLAYVTSFKCGERKNYSNLHWIIVGWVPETSIDHVIFIHKVGLVLVRVHLGKKAICSSI